MANKYTKESEPRTFALDTTGVKNLGDAATGVVGTMVLQISGIFSGSLVLRKKVHGSVVADASAPTTWYEAHDVGTTPIAAGTALTAAALIKVYLDGCDLILDYTASTGTMVVEIVPMQG